MKIRVYVDKLDKEESLDVVNLNEIFSKLGLHRDSFIIVRDDELITEKINLDDGDYIKLLSVISGG